MEGLELGEGRGIEGMGGQGLSALLEQRGGGLRGGCQQFNGRRGGAGTDWGSIEIGWGGGNRGKVEGESEWTSPSEMMAELLGKIVSRKGEEREKGH
jgi:hypothetical protein